MEFETDFDQLKIIYVLYVGQNVDGENIYHFLISKNSEDTWAEQWEEKPAGICKNLTPSEDMYEYVKELKTSITLDLAQTNLCFSMQDCRDQIIPLAYENLDNAETYPEKGRIVIHFGDTIEKVGKMLAKRDLWLETMD